MGDGVAVFDGKPMADDMVAWCKRITRGNVTTVTAGPQTMMKATFTLDETKKPTAIDYVNSTGREGKVQAGIYELRGFVEDLHGAAGPAAPEDVRVPSERRPVAHMAEGRDETRPSTDRRPKDQGRRDTVSALHG
jgi:uncharacterized protein (TIGR03067 family)